MRQAVLNPGLDHDACGVGFIARLSAGGSHEIVELALTALDRLTHRGGVDSDGLSGDGAGLLLPILEEFFRSRAQDANIRLKIDKKDILHNNATPTIDVDPETYEVRVDGALITCDPASVLRLAQRYFLF